MSRCNGGNTVKRIGIISTTALFLLIGIIAPANGQQEKQEEKAKPEKQEQQAKPEKQQQAKADRYRGYFGRDHAFRIYSYPVDVYGGYPRFQYGGFWFGLMNPWPEYWSDYWYDTDDVYIDYSGDGYYMYNRRYPRDRIAITVYVN
jgi:hypothetical protein